MLPALPPWAGMHPLLVHFPIALLFITPVFLGLALFLGRRTQIWGFAALILICLGTGGIFIAAASGEAAGKLVERSPEVNLVLERHEHLAEAARGIFSGLALAFAALVLIPIALKRTLPAWAHASAHGLFLVAFALSLGFLTQIAHEGGRLVHQYGVHALMAASADPPPQGMAPEQEREKD